MQDFLQQENGVPGLPGFRPISGWQQDSFLPASEERQFRITKRGTDGSNRPKTFFILIRQ
jgi:hypothetical protein